MQDAYGRSAFSGASFASIMNTLACIPGTWGNFDAALREERKMKVLDMFIHRLMPGPHRAAIKLRGSANGIEQRGVGIGTPSRPPELKMKKR